MLNEVSPKTSGRLKIEIYQNERYSPISGWSGESLLMTDRGKYSTHDGGISFNSLEEASHAFISMGWIWESEGWERDRTISNVDDDGYSYATDFIGFDSEFAGSGVKTMIHFVRRKKFLRWQYFDANMIANDPKFTCDNCDLEEIDRLDILLRDSVVEASLKRHPRYISSPKINAIKDSLITMLKLNDPKPVLDEAYSTDAIKKLIEDLILHGGSSWTMASAVFTGSTIEYQSHRMAEVVRDFQPFERIEIAKLIIRKHDKGYNYHCSVRFCNDTMNCQCIFAKETCPNLYCGVVYSKKWDKKHDAICPEKILDCDRLCGEKVIRKNMATHLEISCTLRPVTCPFASLGCSAVCAFRSLDDHMAEYVQSHLLLSLHRIEEQQTVIISLNRKLQHLESHVGDFERQYTATTTGLAAAIAAIELSEKKGFKIVTDEISKVDSKSQRLTYDLGQELRTEITKIKRHIKIPT